jgi:hypothetical protein
MKWLREMQHWAETAAFAVAAAAAIGLVLQFAAWNRRSEQSRAAEWQAAIVYRMIETRRALSFKEIADGYVREAERSPLDVPADPLSDGELYLALIRLLQSQAIVQTADQRYSARTAADPLASVAAAITAEATVSRNIARHAAIGTQTLLLSTEERSIDAFKAEMAKAGADRQFLDDNWPAILQQMLAQGFARFLPGGRIAPAMAPAPPPHNDLPASLQPLKGQLDGPLIRLVMALDPLSPTDVCFASAADFKSSREYARAEELGILSLTDRAGERTCPVVVHVVPTARMGQMQGVLYRSALAPFE